MRRLNHNELETVQGGIKLTLHELETTDVKIAGVEVPSIVKRIKNIKLNPVFIKMALGHTKAPHIVDFNID